MEETFHLVALNVALAVEAAAVLAVAIGAAEAVWRLSAEFLPLGREVQPRRLVWIRFATWIILSLEFTLGADIVRTAIAPSWDDIGKLAAIATIRTALNFFLARDIREMAKAKPVERRAAG
ncbi:MAG: DUF1622 domain-containing protein [Alphaproteobacteria bacterium]